MASLEILDPEFRAAVSALDAGDVDGLEDLLAAHPRLAGDRLAAAAGGESG
jgi:DNA-binding GntR family transcriptional regulator